MLAAVCCVLPAVRCRVLLHDEQAGSCGGHLRGWERWVCVVRRWWVGGAGCEHSLDRLDDLLVYSSPSSHRWVYRCRVGHQQSGSISTAPPSLPLVSPPYIDTEPRTGRLCSGRSSKPILSGDFGPHTGTRCSAGSVLLPSYPLTAH